jgi:hypothetical protein
MAGDPHRGCTTVYLSITCRWKLAVQPQAVSDSRMIGE